MKIYQLHEYNGDYEDFTDTICGSYLRKERAEEAKIDAEAREKELQKRAKKCKNCPYVNNKPLSKYPNYCAKAELEESEDWQYVFCKNYYIHWYESTFKIEEVEVEE